jgi:molecular chaperone HtpG
MELEQLSSRLDEEPGVPVPLPIDPNQIGGELLAILSKGLYTNPLDSVREYAQNGIDAGAENLTITITGNSVMIMDDGRGMSFEELLQAREFGLSPKSLKEHIGFRGIGIYSGFDLCNQLQITTKVEGGETQHVMIFDFAEMRRVLDLDRAESAGQRRTSLIELLSQHTFIMRETASGGSDSHYTIVQLDDISDVHMRHLHNRSQLKNYLLQNLPVNFSDSFMHKNLINDLLRRNVPGYKAVNVILQSDGLPDEVVAKYDQVGLNLQTPLHNYINTSSGKQVAFYWACMNAERGKLQPKSRESGEDQPDYEGLVYKVKGFTVGDRHRIGQLWERVGKIHLYPWYTGEVYVLDTEVIPNAERDDFETNHAKASLEAAVADVLESLEDQVEKFRAEGVANEKIAELQEQFQNLAGPLKGNVHPNDIELLFSLRDLKKKFQDRRKSATGDYRKIADQCIRQIDRLETQLRKDVDSEVPESARKKRAAKKEDVPHRAAVPSPRPIETIPTQRSLEEVLRAAGWDLEGETARLVELVQSALDGVLSRDSGHYRSLLTEIEDRLALSLNEH